MTLAIGTRVRIRFLNGILLGDGTIIGYANQSGYDGYVVQRDTGGTAFVMFLNESQMIEVLSVPPPVPPPPPPIEPPVEPPIEPPTEPGKEKTSVLVYAGIIIGLAILYSMFSKW